MENAVRHKNRGRVGVCPGGKLHACLSYLALFFFIFCLGSGGDGGGIAAALQAVVSLKIHLAAISQHMRAPRNFSL